MRDVNNHRDRARQYFSCVMATGDMFEMVQAGYVVLALDGREPTNAALSWLNICTASFDHEKARMATMALGVILDGRSV
jgi:hypothetical protein